MSGQRRRAAIVVMRWSAFLLPIKRRQWVEAMNAEIEAINDDGAALDFALGCLWTSTKERVCSIELFARSLCIGIPAGLLTLASLAAYFSGHHGWVSTQAGTVFGLLFVVFAVGAGLFLVKGAIALARFAGMLVPIYLALLLFLRSARGASADEPVSALYWALAIEGIAIWSTLFLLALLLSRAPAMHRSGNQGRP